MSPEVCHDSPALTIFDRIGFAVKPGKSKPSPLSMGTVPKSAKTSFPRIPLKSTIKQCPDFKGFFVSAVLRRYNSAQGGDTARLKFIRRMNGTLSQYQNEIQGASNKHQLCSHGIAS